MKASYTKIRELPPAWFEFLADQRPLSDVFYRLENGRFRHGLLEEREGQSAPRVRFESELEDHLSESDAEKTLLTVIAWGRSAEISSYGDARRMFSIDHVAG